jgi:thiamine biosynthesis lipoprotein
MIKVPEHLLNSVICRVRETMRTECRENYHQITFRAMSTPVRVAFRAEESSAASDCHEAVLEWVAGFEARYSRFLPESIVGQINAGAGGGWMSIDAETEELFSLCQQMFAFTGGAFDPAALPLVRLWDWKRNPPQVPAAADVDAARRVSGWNKVERRRGAIKLPVAGMGIDLGGIGKEYAVDRVVALLLERGMTNVLVDIGQDIRVTGHPPGKDAWYIGLEEPDQAGRCWTCLRLTDQAVATSGDYFRSFSRNGRRYGHILDPRSGEPVGNGCQAATVIAPTCLMAGILSTAAFILGPRDGLELITHRGGAEGCITTDAARHQTRRFSYYVPA